MATSKLMKYDAAVAALALKANVTALALKADVTALALKADSTTVTAGLALKADTTALTAGLALKPNVSAMTAADAAVTAAFSAADAAVTGAAAAALTAGLATRQKKITCAENEPLNPEDCDEWIVLSTLIRWIWLEDIDSGQWVELGPLGGTGTGTPQAFATLTDGATVTWAVNAGYARQNAKLTLGGNRTLAITGLVDGVTGTLKVTQDGTGSRTLALPANSRVQGNGLGLVTLTATAGAVDKLEWCYDGTYLYWDVPHLNYTSSADVTAPTLVSSTVLANGTTLRDVYSETVQIGAGGSAGRTLTPTGAAVTLSSPVVTGTQIDWTISRAILQTSEETAVSGYATTANGIEDIAGNDLVTFSGVAVANNSTQSGAAATAFVTGVTLGALAAAGGYYGMKITVGAAPITVTEVGIYGNANHYSSSMFVFVRSAAGANLGNKSVTWGAAAQFYYATLDTPVVLSASTVYYIMTDDLAYNEIHYTTTTVTTTAVAVVNDDAAGQPPAGAGDGAGHCIGPVTFKYTL